MNLQDLKKTVKENTPAIVTSVIVFLFVGFYMAVLVPDNVRKYDNINKSTLEEFNFQFNNTLKDYAGQVDVDNLKDSIAQKALRLCIKCQKNKRDSSSVILLLNDLKKCDSSSVLKKMMDNVIIQSVRIDSISNKSSEIIINKRINLKFSFSALKTCQAKNCKTLNELCWIKDTSRIDKGVLKKRLGGAIAFHNWVIYSADNKQIFLNQGIDKEEFDSIKLKTSKSGVLTFTFSDKRFYRQSVAVDGTSNTFMLVGAISQADFEQQSKKVNLNSTFISAFLVLLLLLSIPLLKPLISSRKEKQTQFDLLNITTGIGILTIVLVCFSFIEYLSISYKDISCENLVNLSDSVSAKLNGEFKPYYNAFNMVNSKLKDRSEYPIHDDLDTMKFDSLADRFMNDLNKNNFQNFFTFDSKGDLVKDISDKGVFEIRRNFSERDYFKVLKEQSYSNLFTAVFSKYDNKLKFVYVRKNYITEKIVIPKDPKKSAAGDTTRIDTVDFSLSGFAFKPEFVDDIRNTINSGYLLCNNTGRVIFNSDINKSLNEDIYANSQKNYELSKMLHGMTDSIFEMQYNGEQCLFYAKKYTGNVLATTKAVSGKDSTYNAILNDYPLYLLTYKSLGFTDQLKIYTIINGFIISLAYVLSITFLILLYSVFFYGGEISILSRYHLHWMFPDNSRRKEYILLKWMNYGTFALFMILFIFGYRHTLYLSFLSGINLAFLNFLFLNQRVFLLLKDKGGKEKTIIKRNSYLLKWFFSIGIFGYVIPLILFTLHFPSFGLCLSLVTHFVILADLKRDSTKSAIPDNRKICRRSNRPFFIGYFLSVVSYHYLLIPLLVIFNLFISEVNIVKDLNNSYFHNDKIASVSDIKKQDDILKTDGRVISILPVEPPSKKYLELARFDNFKSMSYVISLKDFIKTNYWFIFLMLICLIIIAVFIRKLIDFYSGRFFFYELSEAYRLHYFEPVEPMYSLTNFKVIIPPYSKRDLENLELTEKFNEDIPEFKQKLKEQGGDSKVWLKSAKPNIVSNQVKVELIMMNHFETYRDQYKKIWDLLTEEEKFVMNDFAVDSFVNHKNRNVLLNLMKKGYIIADPLTGRLRVMNYGFRNFIIHLEVNDPESAIAIKEEEDNLQGTYSKWKLPLMIIAVSGIIMFMYLNKESFSNVLFVGGSVISAVGLIAKFLNVYKG